MKCSLVLSLAAGAGLFAFGTRASAGPEPAPIAIVFEPSAADLAQAEIRNAVASELHRAVRTDLTPSSGQLRIGRNVKGELVVRYVAPENELERTVAVPADKGRIPLLLALVAQNLVSGEPRELMIELDRNRRAGSPTAESAEPAAPRAGDPARGKPIAPAVPELAASKARSGLHVRLSLSAGYGAGFYTFEGESVAALPPTRHLEFTVNVSGPSEGLEVALGYMTSDGIAVGAEGSIIGAFPLTMQGNLGATKIDYAILGGVNAYVDYYPDQRGPLHIQAGLGFARATLASQTIDIGSFDNIVVVRPAGGPAGYIGAGYDVRGAGGLGFFVRTHTAYLSETQSSFTTFDVRLGASMSWF